MKTFATLIVSFCFYSGIHAQNTSDRLSVFLDCTQSWICDYDYVRSEITAVDFVRDRFVADVHILVTNQRSSSGGIQAALNFIGLRRFKNMQDTLTYFTDPTATEDEQRKKMVQLVKVGLVPFLARTSAVDQLEVGFGNLKSNQETTTITNDPWNFWVFQLGANGGLNGSQNYKSHEYTANISADRETEEWKINFDVSAYKQVDTYIDDVGKESEFTRKEYYSNLQVAKSINAHWSYGLSASFTNSLFSNIKTGIKFRPKIEYSLFPYSKFNTQRVVAQYMVGPVYNNYYDTTVYFATEETLMQQHFNIITSFTKPWGNINIGLFFSNYFDDLEKNNLSFNGAVSWKIAKGLNFALWGNYGLIHDQIALRKGQATRDQLLVRNRELRSSYRYNLGVGFSYRFGSVQNSVVNPRFRGLSYSINF